MYPIFKLVSLTVRLFSRPAIDLMKRVHYSKVSKTSWLNYLLQRLGNLQYKVRVKFQTRLKHITRDNEMFELGLQRDVALEKGIHFFYETLFYTTVIGATLYESYRILNANRERNKDNILKLEKISADLDKLIEAAEELILESEQRKTDLETNLSTTRSLLDGVFHHTEEILARERKLHAFVKSASDAQERLLSDLKEIECRLG